MTDSAGETRILLQRFHEGDRAALARLVHLHYDWLESQIRRKLNTDLRRAGDTVDFLNDLVVKILEQGPRFVVSDEEHFRRLLLVMVRNVIADGGRRLHAKKRDRAVERRMPTQATILYLDSDPPKADSPTRPDQRVMADEQAELARLAMELIPPAERRAIEMQQVEDMSFAQIGEAEGISAEGARKRFHSGLKRLQQVMQHLKQRDTLTAIREAGA